MAIYFGLVITKQWKAGTAILVDDYAKMITRGDMGLVIDEGNEIRIF
jgi:hypothetical protein